MPQDGSNTSQHWLKCHFIAVSRVHDLDVQRQLLLLVKVRAATFLQ